VGSSIGMMTTPRILLICLAFYPLLVGFFLGLAGELDPLDRATLAVTCVSHFLATLLCVHDKDLIRERFKPGPGAPLWDRVWLRFVLVLMLANMVVLPLDIGRFHWTGQLPDAWQIVGLVGIVIGMLLIACAMRANTFFFIGGPPAGGPGTPSHTGRALRPGATSWLRGGPVVFFRVQSRLRQMVRRRLCCPVGCPGDLQDCS